MTVGHWAMTTQLNWINSKLVRFPVFLTKICWQSSAIQFTRVALALQTWVGCYTVHYIHWNFCKMQNWNRSS